MIQHIRLIEWEKKLKTLFDEVNDMVEEKFGNLYPLRPSRAQHSTTSNREQDGLFNIGASFTLGIGSQFGPGYSLDIRLATMSPVAEELKNKIESEVVKKISEELPRLRPDLSLTISRDGPVYKIHGDLGLGTL